MAKHIQHGSQQPAARQQEQYSEGTDRRQDGDPPHALRKPPERDADRRLLAEQDNKDDDANDLEQPTELHRREERHRPVPLDRENIGLQHVSGINDEQVGRELNISGTEDNDEDDNGNPVAGREPSNP